MNPVNTCPSESLVFIFIHVLDWFFNWRAIHLQGFELLSER